LQLKNPMKIIIGTRESKLALWQAEFVKSELEKYHKDLVVELKPIKTKGDKILDVALSKIGDKGLFTKELENQLLDGMIDLAVHSLKDLQTSLFDGLKIGAITKRHDVEDVLIAREKNINFSSTHLFFVNCDTDLFSSEIRDYNCCRPVPQYSRGNAGH